MGSDSTDQIQLPAFPALLQVPGGCSPQLVRQGSFNSTFSWSQPMEQGKSAPTVYSPLPKATVSGRWPLFKVYLSHQALVTATPFGLLGQALGTLTIVLRPLGQFLIPSSSLNPDHISLNKPLTIFSSITYFGMCHLLLPGTLTDKHHAYLLTAFQLLILQKIDDR